MNSTLTTWFWRGAIVTLLITFLSPKTQAQSKPRQFTSKYKTLGYRSCGLGQSACHGGNKPEGKWWKSDPHYGTLDDLKRKKARSQQIAQLYGMKPENYLRSNQRCADCHGQAVSKKKKMNAGVSCEDCHGPAGPENTGYFTVHQIGDLPADPLDTGRTGYQKALKVGLRKLRDVKVRAKLCVRCHLITEKKLLEAGHPSGEGFDYVNKGIKNSISEHWDYKPRAIDLQEEPYITEINKRPVPQVVLKSFGGGRQPSQAGRETKTIYIRVGEEAPPWLRTVKTVTLEPFEPNVTDSTSIDSILMMVKDRIELIHKKIRGKNE